MHIIWQKNSASLINLSIEIFHCSLNKFCEANQQKYAVIVSNPPFFYRIFLRKSAKYSRNIQIVCCLFESLIVSSSSAAHRWRQLLFGAAVFIARCYSGYLSLYHLHIVRQLIIYPKVGKNSHRILLEIKTKAVCEINSLYFDANGYTADYIALTKRFYTIF